MADEKMNEKTKRQVPMLSSIRFRVMCTVGAAVFITLIAIILVVTIPVRRELEKVNSNYLFMTTQMYGQPLLSGSWQKRIHG